LPSAIGPPRPLDQLRPLMKEADALAVLAAAGVKPIKPKAGTTLFALVGGEACYQTVLPDTYALLGFTGGRLTEIQIRAVDPVSLSEPLIARWGKGTFEDLSYEASHEWPASASGWHARLRLPPRDNKYPDISGTRGTLSLIATNESTQQREQLLAVDGKTFPQLASLIGASLADAEKTLGPALHRETADDEDRAAEVGARRQGFARCKVPWSDSSWELVLRTDTSDRIASIRLTGTPTTESRRIAMFAALKAAFGAPRPVVSPAGRVEIELGSSVIAHVAEGDSFVLTLSRP
jgi:hypothetical protein